MERTESKIIQAHPDYENDMIREMGRFAWNLQGRQEIHEKGDAYGSPDIIGGGYTTRTEVSKYVKLHFVRSPALSNLDKVRQIESEYFSLPFPSPPTGWTGFAIIMIIMGIIVMGIIVVGMGVIGMGMGEPTSLKMILLGIAGAGLGYFAFNESKKEKENAIKIQKQSARRAEQLLAELKALGYG
ncbi:MAG: hypothetical protein DDT30_01942 [Dehalococcoidia bacterium]|nr:hypothetical protein [Bacillota bacterium]